MSYLVASGEGEAVVMGGLGVVHKLSGLETGGSFSVVEHPIAPGVLAAPPHTHEREDEFSLVVEGEIGVQIGNEEFTAGRGAYVLKPRGVSHTFWNPGPGAARVVEIISPAGFERYFDEIAEVIAAASGGPPDFGRISEIAGSYGLIFHMDRMPALMERHGVELR